MITISPIYAGLLALLTIYLSVRVSLVRRAEKISVGVGESAILFKATRVHANSIEYIPIGILLFVLLELQGAPSFLVHLSGAALLIGRVLHAYGLGSQPQVVSARVYGAYTTLITIVASAIANIWFSIT